VDTSDAYLALFDVLTYEEWQSGISELNQIERKEQIEHMDFDDCIHKVAYTVVNLDEEKGQTKFKELNEAALQRGYEGLMVKPTDGLYECKRSTQWLKIKPFIEVTLEVIDVEEGTGKNEGTTGALVCEGTDDGTFINVNVGSGLTDNDRENIWSNKDDVIGQLVEIRADAITQNQDKTYSLRFPRFKTFRGFDIGEKL
jgi:DNA ligase-1